MTVANGSLVVMTTCALAATTFQLASTALIVTGNATPAACVEMPTELLPVEEPGTALSPGTRICSLTALLADTEKVEETTVPELESNAAPPPEVLVAVKELMGAEVTS